MTVTIVTFRRFLRARDAWLTNWMKYYSMLVLIHDIKNTVWIRKRAMSCAHRRASGTASPGSLNIPGLRWKKTVPPPSLIFRKKGFSLIEYLCFGPASCHSFFSKKNWAREQITVTCWLIWANPLLCHFWQAKWTRYHDINLASGK